MPQFGGAAAQPMKRNRAKPLSGGGAAHLVGCHVVFIIVCVCVFFFFFFFRFATYAVESQFSPS
jgi:hypothetical protein